MTTVAQRWTGSERIAHRRRVGGAFGTLRAVPTALLSVYDKAGVADLAKGLHELGWRLLSSGGTARTIADAGLPVTDVADLTGYPAILGHRVVTLHPVVHGGLLADLSDPEHRRDLATHGIEPIDLLVAGLYPFESEPSVELIDVGGPAMIRAAAKNHARVGVVTGRADYDTVLDELRADGALSAATRRRLARAAFATTSAYDAAIVDWLAGDGDAPGERDAVMPAALELRLDRVQELRYGENPHQVAARYRQQGASSWWDVAVQHGGKELSYLNVFDTEAAWRLVHRFDRPACVIVKHANPCGVAVADDITAAYQRANGADPVSAFGGIVAVNRPVPDSLALALAPVFTEVVVAPGYEDDALATLTAKTKLRVLGAAPPGRPALDVRTVDGGLLVQTGDPVEIDRSSWWVVTSVEPTRRAMGRPGVGVDGVRRSVVERHRVRPRRADRGHRGRAAEPPGLGAHRRLPGRRPGRRRGVRQRRLLPVPRRSRRGRRRRRAGRDPARGSVRDAEVIDAADEHGIAMVFTGQRHFRH